MARPKVFDYDPEHDEIVTKGVEGAEMYWIGIGLSRQVFHIICNEGILNQAGDGIETVTRKRQVNLEEAKADAFYIANKDAIDSLTRASFAEWVSETGKTGEVVES